MFNLFAPTIRDDFVVIDSVSPQRQPFAFRNTEINQYLKRIKNFASYTMYPMPPGPEAWFTENYGMTLSNFQANKQGYLLHYPQNKRRIHFLDRRRRYSFKLAYSFFLGETYTLLPFYERYGIPFVFVLYPGGRFSLGMKESDNMLRKIFQSPWFRGIIVTQPITRDYLVRKKLCPKTKIHYIYGGFVQFKPSDVKPKKLFKKDKQTFDICFVAAKYSDQGRDKGYDLFVRAANLLAKTIPDIRFHVVGGFTPDDIDVSGIKDQITFYGYQMPDFLADFYSGMDIFLGPNRPFVINEGSFDGFPLGIDAGYCGVALFVADELGLNHHYQPDQEIVIVPLDAQKIASLVEKYYNNPDSLYELSKRGQTTTQGLFDIDHQINKRLKLFAKFVNLEMNE